MGDMWPMFLEENVGIAMHCFFQVIPKFLGCVVQFLVVESPKFPHTFPTIFPAQLQITLANPTRYYLDLFGATEATRQRTHQGKFALS